MDRKKIFGIGLFFTAAALALVTVPAAVQRMQEQSRLDAAKARAGGYIDSLKQIEKSDGKPTTDSWSKIQNGLASTDPDEQMWALGLGMTVKEPEKVLAIQNVAKQLTVSKDEFVRTSALTTLMKTKAPDWRSTVETAAKSDPSQYVRDMAQQILTTAKG
ncbi:MAG: hypothetical protein JSS66_06905 [Armatimonadetes bacterium]|nr:hypothetical protein [Armatimonadota bacterium]